MIRSMLLAGVLASIMAGLVLTSQARSESCCSDEVAACSGATNCKVCKDCSRCKHCKTGGSCGACSAILPADVVRN